MIAPKPPPCEATFWCGQVVHQDVTTTIAEAGPPSTVKTGDSMREPAFNAFVEARSTPLLRTAYLLTRDRGLAEA